MKRTCTLLIVAGLASTASALAGSEPDKGWYQMQEVSLEQAVSILQSVADGSVCTSRFDITDFNIGCITGYRDGLHQAVRNSTFKYKNLSDAVLITKDCYQDKYSAPKACIQGALAEA
jgi:hypothetical protein